MLYTAIIMYKQGLARVLAANNLMWWSVLSNAVWGVLLLFSFYWLRHFGALGLAASLLLAYIANALVFVPFYARRHLVPRDTLISLRAAVVWGAILCPAVLSFLNMPLAVRTTVLCVVVAAVVVNFWHLTKSKEFVSNRQTGLLLGHPS
jgi:uncharacterized membrane protein YfcA